MRISLVRASASATLAVTITALGFPSSAGAQVSPSAYTTGYRYDVAGRPVGTIAPDPDGSGPLPFIAERRGYNGAGTLARVENGRLSTWQGETVAPANWSGFVVTNTTDLTYDVNGRLVREDVYAGSTRISVTQRSYDAAGRLECVAVRMNETAFGSLPASACALSGSATVNPDRITRTTYDAHDFVATEQRAYGTSLQQTYASYTRTASGKPTSIVDANGNRAAMDYDEFGRQRHWWLPSANAAGQTSADDYEEYGYDAGGNRVRIRRRDGRILTFGYDALNRLVSKLVPDGCAPIQRGACPAGTATRDVYYGYDLRGLQTYARFDTAQGDGVATVYDGFGAVLSSTSTYAGVNWTLDYRSNANGNRTRLTWPDGAYAAFDYDGMGRWRTATTWSPGGATRPAATISYDADGGRSRVERGVSATEYGVDAIGRLTGQNQRFTGGSGDTTGTFSYNAAGQMVSRTQSNDAFAFTRYASVDRSYATNGLNQYTAAGPASFAYDANGNLIADGTGTYGYDAENRLVSGPGGVALAYDPLGRLLRIGGGADGATAFLWDGDALVAEYDAVTGSLRRRYVHGAGVDEPLLWDEGSALDCTGTRFLHPNHQGSIVATADCAGNRVAVNSYDEYGIPGSGNVGRFQYTGQAWLPELGMYHYKARLYSPTLGRFLQTDPIGYDDQVNLYAYVANDPVNAVDPSGKRIKLVGSAAYQREVLREIRQLQSRPAGNEMLSKQIASTNEIVVRPTADGDPAYRGYNRTVANDDNAAIDGSGTGSTIYFDPKNTGGIDVNGSNVRPSAVGLGHEFGHSEDNDRGTRPPASAQRTPGTTPPQEQNAIRRENQIRAEHGLPARTTYTPPAGCPSYPSKCR